MSRELSLANRNCAEACGDVGIRANYSGRDVDEIQRGNIRCHMPMSGDTSDYALGNTDAEHERSIRQAMLLAPLTERFLTGAWSRVPANPAT